MVSDCYCGNVTPASSPDIDGPTPSAGHDSLVEPARRKWPWLLGIVVIGGLLGAAGWLGSRVLIVRDDLESSRATLAQLRAGGDMSQGLRTLAARADSAVATSSDPLWRIGEGLPWMGNNLRAVRLSAESLRLMTSGLALPALDALSHSDGGPMLARVLPAMQAAAGPAAQVQSEIAELDEAGLISQVRSGLDQVSEVLDATVPILQILPGMLGADGERQYLMVAQSNAETLPLGGSAASQTLIRIAPSGDISIAAQADSGDFKFGAPDVKLDQSAIDLYGPALTMHFNNAPGRPDFPTAARLMTALWQRDIQKAKIDGVISVDPLALARVLVATGPVSVPGWGEITSQNVVSVVLSEIYALPDQEVADQIFKVLAAKVFERVATGGFDLAAMTTAVRDSVDAGSILFWSADERVQKVVSSMRVGGVLPTLNKDASIIGVYFRDGSLGSKIDYYVKTAANVSAACSAGTTTFRAQVTIHLDISKAAEAKLPPYVRGGRTSLNYRTQVFIYGPPGTKVTKVQYKKPTWRWGASDIEDLGRPVASLMINHDPGESVTIAMEFKGDASDYGPVSVRTTPMVHPTKVSVHDGRCGG